MTEFVGAVAFHYSGFERTDLGILHPDIDDMIYGRGDFAASLAKAGIDLHVTFRTSPVAEVFEPPFGRTTTVKVDTDPQFLTTDGVDPYTPNYTREGTLSELGYLLIFDRDAQNHGLSSAEAGETDMAVPMGTGVDDRLMLNSPRIQALAGNKREADRLLLEPAGLALETYHPNEEGMEAILRKYGDIEVITKPLGTARAVGIQTHESLSVLQAAIREGHVSGNEMLQPFVNQRIPIPGLRAFHPDQQEALDEVNASGVVREVRMHFGVWKDEHGQVHTWTYPTLRHNNTMGKIMGADCEFIPLHPDSLPDDTMPTGTVGIAGRLLDVTDGWQAYGSADWVQAVLPNGEECLYVIEDNLRSPYMPRNADPARNDLMFMMGAVAHRNRRLVA